MYFLNRRINFHFKIKKRYSLLIIFISAIIMFALIKNYRRIKIIDFNNTIEIYSRKKRVKEILKFSKINIDSDDLVIPDLDSELKEEQYTIRIYRSENIRISKIAVIPQKTIEIETLALPKGHILQINPGSKGFNQEVYIHKYIDGLKVDEIPVDVNVISKPRNKIILKGISEKYKSINDENVINRTALSLNASAYSPSAVSCYPFDDGMTAIGLRADYGIAAVDPRVIPLGSLLYIEGYGYAVAGDVGAAIKNNTIDLCFRNNKIALEYGRKPIKCYVLD